MIVTVSAQTTIVPPAPAPHCGSPWSRRRGRQRFR
jgi:hypothetical protein